MMKNRGELPGDLVTATVMSNIGFHKYVEGMGCKVEVTSVGDRYVLESMLKTGCNTGVGRDISFSGIIPRRETVSCLRCSFCRR